MRNFLALFFLICPFLSNNLFSQGKTAYANFEITEPGEVKFPAGVKKLVLANRSYQKTFFPDKNKCSYLYELQKLLLSSNSYAVDILQLETNLRNANADTVLPALDWNTVSQLLNGDTTAELVVLEQSKYIRFDYVYQKKYGDYPGYTYKASNGEQGGYNYKYIFTYQYYTSYPYLRIYSDPFVSTVGTGIKTGTQYFWRIYDLKTKTILDDYEDRTTDNYYYINPLTFLDNPEQYMFLYYNEVIAYAYHLLPHLIPVSREYYTGGNDDMKTANDYATIGQLDSSKVIWENLAKHSSGKIGSKACFNYALSWEIDGNLDSALVYAEKSKQLGDKNAPYYCATLRKRLEAKKIADAEIKNGQGVIAVINNYRKRY